ncbi:MAG: hypothetical protein ACKO14_07530 [Armatimonadota bacterium]
MPHPGIANRRLLIQHSFHLVADRDTVINHLLGYWKTRGFNIFLDEDGNLSGTRGSYLANFTSFDSTKLIASIFIECSDHGHVQVTTLIDLSGQILTAWNQLDLELEQVLCQRSFIGLPEPDTLSTYRRSEVMSNIMWVLTLGLTTHTIPAKFLALLEEVNPSLNAPALRFLSPGEY